MTIKKGSHRISLVPHGVVAQYLLKKLRNFIARLKICRFPLQIGYILKKKEKKTWLFKVFCELYLFSRLILGHQKW